MSADERFNPEPGERLHFGEPGHFICASRCEWFEHTHVGQFCISSVGEFRPRAGGPLDTVGLDRMYETMVFLWDADANDGKGDTADWSEVERVGSNDRETAQANHDAALDRWASRSWHRGEVDHKGDRACIPDQPWSA